MRRLYVSNFILILFLIGCTDKSSPEYITKQYLTAFKNKNFEEAKSYCSESGIEYINCIIRIGQTDNDITEINNIKCKEKDNAAKCTFCCTSQGESSVNLVKIDNEWLITGKKEICPDLEEE